MRTYMVLIQNRNTDEQRCIFFYYDFTMAHAVRDLLDDEEMRVELYKRGVWGYERVNIADELGDVK